MSLFSGLDKSGLKSAETMETLENTQKEKEDQNIMEKQKELEKQQAAQTQKAIPPEKDFLLPKTTHCMACDQDFKVKTVKSGKARRLQPDRDLRPRFQYIDTLKYDVASCPFCGYTAMTRDFDKVTSTQIKLIKEQISAKFQPSKEPEEDSYSYDKAIERYKLALLNAAVKRGKESEKAYICLKISWLIRGKADTLPGSTQEELAVKEKLKKEEDTFYLQAYEGFSKAISQEMFPIYGMDESTMDYLLAYMSFYFKKYEMASKFLGGVLTSATASPRLKDMALDLKQDIVAQMKR